MVLSMAAFAVKTGLGLSLGCRDSPPQEAWDLAEILFRQCRQGFQKKLGYLRTLSLMVTLPPMRTGLAALGQGD